MVANRDLTGPGGIGKTRFALEVGRNAADRFADGVVFVPLEALTARMVLCAIAARLGVQNSGTRPALDALVDELADRNLLLIVDTWSRSPRRAGRGGATRPLTRSVGAHDEPARGCGCWETGSSRSPRWRFPIPTTRTPSPHHRRSSRYRSALQP